MRGGGARHCNAFCFFLPRPCVGGQLLKRQRLSNSGTGSQFPLYSQAYLRVLPLIMQGKKIPAFGIYNNLPE